MAIVYAKMDTTKTDAKITIGAYDFLSSEHDIESISITNGCYDGRAPGIGAVYSKIATIKMKNIPAIKKGQKIEISFSESGYGNWHTAGEFYVSEQPVASSDFATINAHGVLIEYGDQVVNQYRSWVNTIGNVLYYTQKQIGKYINWIYPDDFDMKTYAELMSREVMFTRKPLDYETELGGNGAENLGITIREALSGLAILYGGNVFEGTYNGDIKIQPNAIYTDKELIFGEDTYIESYKYSNKKYAINKINLSLLPYVGIEWHDPNGNLTVRTMDYNSESGDRVKDEMMVSASDLSAYNAYDYTIECDWIGWPNEGSSYEAFNIWANSAEQWKQWDYTPGGRVTPCLVQGDLIFNSGSFEFVGYNENITPGNIINIQVGEETVNLYCGEVTWEWDGGFTTKVSCNCNVDGDGAYSSSGASSSVASASNANSAMQNYNSINFANITFSNVKDSTISGSKFIDGSIKGSKISDSTLTGSKFKNGTIEGSKINFSTFEDGVISGTAIDTSTFKDGSISGSSFVDGTIENSKIKDSTLTGAKIKDSTLTGAKIADATIGIEKVNESFIKDLTAKNAFIDNLTSTVAKINSLTATDAIIRNIFSNKIVSDKAILDVLQANIINAEYIKTAVADVGYITADEADLSYANITLGNIDTANVDKANIGLLFNEVGLIDRATIVDGHITGFLDAVEVNANNITAGTLIADRILLKGSESGLLYALNNLGELTSTNIDTLDGTILTQRTITADKLVANSITANELDVTNIFGNSAVLTTLTSQQAFINAISTNSVVVGASNTANNALNAVNNLEIGGRNLIRNSNFAQGTTYWEAEGGTLSVVSDSTYSNHLEFVLTSSGYQRIMNAVSNVWERGQTYSYSFYAKASESATLTPSRSISDFGKTHTVTTEWKRYTGTIYSNITSSTGTLSFTAGSLNVTYYIANVKLEKGNKATDWTPAPEDISVENIYTPNTTTIDGGKITTGSIKAEQIDVDNLFAQDITATGTITGATLKGTKIYSEIGEIAGFTLKDQTLVSEFTQTDTNNAVWDFKNEINSKANSEKNFITATRTGHKTGLVANKASFGIDGVELESLNKSNDYYDKFMRLSTRSLGFGVNSGTPYNGSNIAFKIDSGYSAITSSGEFVIEPSCTINVPTTVNNNLTITDTLNTYKAEVRAGIEIYHPGSTPYIDFHFGNSTSDYTSRIIEEASGRLKVTGSLSVGDKLYATTLYEGGSLLKNKYSVVKTNTGSIPGTGGWTSITINFGVTFATIPMFNVMFTNGFTTENISVTDISTTSATIWICALDKSFTYQYRWFAVGNIA